MKIKLTKQAEKQKILVKIWEPLSGQLEKAMKKSFLNRDNFLSAVIQREVDCLQNDVTTANSKEARDFIAKQLNQLKLVPMTLRLEATVAQRLSEICEEKRIPRDAFFNRLILYLLMPQQSWETYIFAERLDQVLRRMEAKFDKRPHLVSDGLIPLRAIVALVTDPLRFYRECLAFINEEDADPDSQVTLYGRYLPGSEESPGLSGLNCYVPDALVPTTEAGRRNKELEEKVLEDF